MENLLTCLEEERLMGIELEQPLYKSMCGEENEGGND